MMTSRWNQDVERDGMDTDDSLDTPTISLGWIGWGIRLGPMALYGIWHTLGMQAQANMMELLLHALLIWLLSSVLCAWIELRAALMYVPAWRTRPQGAPSGDGLRDAMWFVAAEDRAR